MTCPQFFTCPKCGGHHFGSATEKREDGSVWKVAEQCHDEFGIGCKEEIRCNTMLIGPKGEGVAAMPQITIGHDGNHEPAQRPADKPVDYLIVLRASLNAEQAAEFEDCEEVILRHPTKPALIRAKVKGAEVIR